MAEYFGWFVKVSSPTALAEEVPALNGDGWELDFHMAYSEGARYFGYDRAGIYSRSDGGNHSRAIYSDLLYSIYRGSLENKEPYHINLKGVNGKVAFQYNGGGAATNEDGAGNNHGRISHLTATDRAGGIYGYVKAVIPDGTLFMELSGNHVLNVDRNGFVSRSDAVKNPEIAESGFENKIYDISGNNRHVSIPENSEWSYISEFEVPAEVIADGGSYAFTAPDNFNVSGIRMGGVNLSFTFDTETWTGTFVSPSMGTVPGFPLFGQVELEITDDVNNTTAQAHTELKPAAPHIYKTFNGDPDTSNMSNGYHQWPDPPVQGNQTVYDPTYYSIEQKTSPDPLASYFGRLVIKPDAPASFAVSEYVIDENGMQEFERNSAAAEAVGDVPTITLNGPSSVTITEGDSYTDQGADWADTEDGGGTVYSSTVVDENTTAGEYTQTYRYVDSDGNASPTVTRTVTVESVENPPTATINTPAQTVTVNGTVQLSATVTDADSIVWTSSLGGTFSDATIEEPEYTAPAGAGSDTITLTVTNADGTATDTVVFTVEVAVLGEFTATHQNVPDGQIETVVVNLDTSEVLFNGMKSWANGQATFSFENLADGSRIQVSTLNETDQDGGLSVEYAA